MSRPSESAATFEYPETQFLDSLAGLESAMLDSEVHVLDRVVRALRNYVIFRDEIQADACALWIAHTYAVDAFDATPYLHITSPEKRSGKTRLFEVLELLVWNPWRVAMPSEAVVFRKIQSDRPTLMLDEVDAIFGKNAKQHEGLRALLNAGHRRGTVVSRCVGEGSKIELRDFEVFCAKALAGIGNLPDTVADRCIRIQMTRKARDQVVPRFRYKVVAALTEHLRQDLAEWMSSVAEDIAQASPAIPSDLDDRAADGWEPLFAIADSAGPEWAARARRAALELSNAKTDGDESTGIRVLADIRACFDVAERLTTDELLRHMVKIDDAPYGEWWGRQLDSDDTRGPGFRLSRMLKPYGIKSRDLRFGRSVLKGYAREDFEDVWARYLPPIPEDPETTQRSNMDDQETGPDSDFGWGDEP